MAFMLILTVKSEKNTPENVKKKSRDDTVYPRSLIQFYILSIYYENLTSLLGHTIPPMPTFQPPEHCCTVDPNPYFENMDPDPYI